MIGTWRDVFSGLATLVVLGLIFSYATWGRALTELGGYDVSAGFHRIDGLVVGSKVRLAGIDVGEVISMRLDTDADLAEVVMRIENDINIPADSVAAIVSDGLFGSKFIEVDPGGDSRMMSTGDSFGFVQDSIDLIGIFQKLVENAQHRLGIDPSQSLQ